MSGSARASGARLSAASMAGSASVSRPSRASSQGASASSCVRSGVRFGCCSTAHQTTAVRLPAKAHSSLPAAMNAILQRCTQQPDGPVRPCTISAASGGHAPRACARCGRGRTSSAQGGWQQAMLSYVRCSTRALMRPGDASARPLASRASCAEQTLWRMRVPTGTGCGLFLRPGRPTGSPLEATASCMASGGRHPGHAC
jgi:hypothetical protein